MLRSPLRLPALSVRMLVLHLVGCVALLSGESFRAPAPTVEFSPSTTCCPSPVGITGR